MDSYNIWYVYRVKYMMQMKLSEILKIEIDALKGGGGCKQKGNYYSNLSPSNS